MRPMIENIEMPEVFCQGEECENIHLLPYDVKLSPILNQFVLIPNIDHYDSLDCITCTIVNQFTKNISLQGGAI